MSFFSKLFQPKNENSVRYKRFMANKINNKSLKYVTERDEENRDIVIGKGGAIHVRDDGQLIVYGGGSRNGDRGCPDRGVRSRMRMRDQDLCRML